MKLEDPPKPIKQASVKQIEQTLTNWVDQADDLYLASVSTWATFEKAACGPEDGRIPTRLRQSRVALLLIGLAVENITKAMLIQKSPGSSPRGHNLLSLARDTGIKLAHSEEEVLSLLTEFVTWAGRYPVPNKINDSFDRAYSPGQIHTGGVAFFLRQRYYVTGGNPPEGTW